MTTRFVPILIFLATVLVVPAFAQEVIAVAPTVQPVPVEVEPPSIDGFTGGVGQSQIQGQDGGAVVIQQIQATSAGTPNVASVGRYIRH